MTSPVPRLVIEALRDFGAPPLHVYGRLLVDACEHAPPPFGQAWYGDRFRSLSAEPLWLLRTLALCSETEGQGSAILWSLAGEVRDDAVAREVREHAVDESRHSRMFLAIADVTFPGGLAPELRQGLRHLGPRYRLDDVPPRGTRISQFKFVDTIIQMNLGEIRTRINQMLLRPVAEAYAPRRNRGRLKRLLDALLRDETRHIAYTARLVEHGVASYGERAVRRVMRKRLAEFNAITRGEVGTAVYD